MKKEAIIISVLLIIIIGLIIFKSDKWIENLYPDNSDQKERLEKAERWVVRTIRSTIQFEDSTIRIISNLRDSISDLKDDLIKVDTKYQKRKFVRLTRSNGELIEEFNYSYKNDTGTILIQLKTEGVIEVLNIIDDKNQCLEKNKILEHEISLLEAINISNDTLVSKLNEVLTEGSIRYNTTISDMNNIIERNNKLTNTILSLEKKKKRQGKLLKIAFAVIVIETLVIFLK